ncbi:rho GTPase-activating protein 29 isoform X3 [Octopus bimaculoides]|uniref:rho GTPase-activating protein 29 isoform X3 n=1 Tax=Octopus bimaculoides TaxID=37653 RepID=UPI00071CCAB3|nr:rho GTPase-activating protein 29 isoform X3 [Octopus bimaculoides]|eukprot:XP_014770650.1 PREDICTED: rho GTPase-activating protein 29-like isoform X3 [Octopus bimaculoides]
MDLGCQLLKSYEVIASTVNVHTPMDETKTISVMGPDEVNEILRQHDSGMDVALQRAKVWSKYLKDIIYYIDKKAQLETDFSKNLIRLAQTTKSTIVEDALLPLQSVYCLLLNMDSDYAASCQKTQAQLQTDKFIRPLATRRAEHDKIRKSIKESWNREVKKMQESISNLRKAQSLFYKSKQENEKAREMANKAETEMNIQGSSSTISTKVDKRKKIVEDTMNRVVKRWRLDCHCCSCALHLHRIFKHIPPSQTCTNQLELGIENDPDQFLPVLLACETEISYRAHVDETNAKNKELDKIKGDLLSKVYEQILLCDETIKNVTVEYFDLLHNMTASVPLQFKRLSESSKQYTPASKYAEFVRRLPSNGTHQTEEELFVFKPYIPTTKSSDDKKTYLTNSPSYSSEAPSQEGSPSCYDISDGTHGNSGSRGVNMKDWSSGDLASDSDSSPSAESSPPVSPRGPIALQTSNVNSLEDLVHGDGEDSEYSQTKSQKVSDSTSSIKSTFFGKHCHTFGIKLEDHLKTFNTDVPLIIKKCLGEIERKGITIKGIYRVSGVKSKVENLCMQFEADPDGVDLEQQHPNVITSVLKMYLRQLPEPLLTFDAYGGFIQTAKEINAGTISGEKIIEKLKELIGQLPPANSKTTSLLISHLQQVSTESDENQMNASNLGIVFGPTLLRPYEGTPLSSLVDTYYQTMSVELLIKHADELFGEKTETVIIPSQESTTAKEKHERVPSTKSSKKSGGSQEESPTLEQLASESFAVSSALPVSVADNASTTTTTIITTSTTTTTTTTINNTITTTTTTTSTSPLAQTTTITTTTSHDPISSAAITMPSTAASKTNVDRIDGKFHFPLQLEIQGEKLEKQQQLPVQQERQLQQQQHQRLRLQQQQLRQKQYLPLHHHEVHLTEPKSFHLSPTNKQKPYHESPNFDVGKKNDHRKLTETRSLPFLLRSEQKALDQRAIPTSQKTDAKIHYYPSNHSDEGVRLTAARSLDTVTSFNPATTSKPGKPASEHIEVPLSALRHIKSPPVVTAKVCVKTTALKPNQPRHREEILDLLPGISPSSASNSKTSVHRTVSANSPVVLTSIIPIEPKMQASETALTNKPTSSKSSSPSVTPTDSLDSSSSELLIPLARSPSDDRQPRFV